MLATPKCYERRCKHLIGVKQDEGQGEIGERFVCKAFPDRIPEEIAFGDNPHTEVHYAQDNEIVFERE
jgi:hypothetical protein